MSLAESIWGALRTFRNSLREKHMRPSAWPGAETIASDTRALPAGGAWDVSTEETRGEGEQAIRRAPVSDKGPGGSRDPASSAGDTVVRTASPGLGWSAGVRGGRARARLGLGGAAREGAMGQRRSIRDIRDLLDCGIVMAKGEGERALAAADSAPQEWTETTVEEVEPLLQWHCANLEFALGAPLDDVSAEWWNFDDACAYSGPHWVTACYGSCCCC